MEKILVGNVLKAQGIKGELKIMPQINDANNFLSFKSLYLDDQKVNVTAVRFYKNFVYIYISTIVDRNQAELLSGKKLYIDKEQMPLDEFSFFVDDVIGCKIFTEDSVAIGEVIDVYQKKGVADIFVVKDGDKELMFPFLKDLLIKVDTENKTIIVKKSRLDEVGFYED